jgi:hypothetical protein
MAIFSNTTLLPKDLLSRSTSQVDNRDRADLRAVHDGPLPGSSGRGRYHGKIQGVAEIETLHDGIHPTDDAGALPTGRRVAVHSFVCNYKNVLDKPR